MKLLTRPQLSSYMDRMQSKVACLPSAESGRAFGPRLRHADVRRLEAFDLGSPPAFLTFVGRESSTCCTSKSSKPQRREACKTANTCVLLLASDSCSTTAPCFTLPWLEPLLSAGPAMFRRLHTCHLSRCCSIAGTESRPCFSHDRARRSVRPCLSAFSPQVLSTGAELHCTALHGAAAAAAAAAAAVAWLVPVPPPGHLGQVPREALDLLEREHLAPAARVVHRLRPVLLGASRRRRGLSSRTRRSLTTRRGGSLRLSHSAETQILHSSAARPRGRQGPAPHRSLWPETYPRDVRLTEALAAMLNARLRDDCVRAAGGVGTVLRKRAASSNRHQNTLSQAYRLPESFDSFFRPSTGGR